MAPNVAVDKLLGTSFKDRFIRGFFYLSNAKPYHGSLYPFRYLARNVKRMNSRTIGNAEAESTVLAQQPAEDEKHELVRVARQIVLKPFTYHLVLVTTPSNGLFAIE